MFPSLASRCGDLLWKVTNTDSLTNQQPLGIQEDWYLFFMGRGVRGKGRWVDKRLRLIILPAPQQLLTLMGLMDHMLLQRYGSTAMAAHICFKLRICLCIL